MRDLSPQVTYTNSIAFEYFFHIYSTIFRLVLIIFSSLYKHTTRENHQLILDFFPVFSKNLRGLSTKYREAVEAGLSGADCEFLYDECTTNVTFF